MLKEWSQINSRMIRQKKGGDMQNIGDVFGLGHRGGPARKLPTDGIMMSVGKAGSGRQALSIGVGVDLMKACRWVTGDRVTIDMDCAKSELTLRRVLPTDKSVVSWALCSRGGTAGEPKGVMVSATVKLQSTPLMLKALGLDDITESYVPDVTITSERGVTFAMRKQWTVINRGGAK
jgi:hypothetical protein